MLKDSMKDIARPWLNRISTTGRIAFVVVLALFVGGMTMRIWMTRNAPELEIWHTFVPDEIDASEIDRADWRSYVAAEARLFDAVSAEVASHLEPEDRGPFNRYYAGSEVHPSRFPVDWNRSFTLEPAAAPRGVVVLLHGLTDSPYSLRHVAELYRQQGFVALAIRLPAHGTVPGALSRVHWQTWSAATRLAMREAHTRAEGSLPIHLVGYSNGGALAVKYALDALGDASLPRPSRIVLFSPMIGVAEGARFAGMAGWPAMLPSFAKSAWLDNLPEFNPFKYGSFPVNAARQSYLLTDALRRQLLAESKAGRLAALPPMLTFQSIVDATVRASAVVDVLYTQLPANGSELVLFDINRNLRFDRFIRPGASAALGELLPAQRHDYAISVVTNESSDSPRMEVRLTPAGSSETKASPLTLAYPPNVFSLSHIALPFPIDDALYGLEPRTDENYGISLGTLGLRGERGVLIAAADNASRISSNPFFSFVLERISQQIQADASPDLRSTAPRADTRARPTSAD
jgi:alpha-beta hydrolase superfamily lysophospholipase